MMEQTEASTEIELLKAEKIEKIEEWKEEKEKLALEWIDLDEKTRNKCLLTGGVYYCDLGENIGYEITKTRPVLVVSDGHYNKNGQVVVVPLTKNTTNYTQRTHYFLKKEKYNFLEHTSRVKTEQIRSVSTNRVKKFKGKIDDQDLNAVKKRIKTLFNL